MLFNSLDFALLVVVTLGLYYLPMLRRAQVGLLLAASLTFYGLGQPYLLALLVGSVLINALSSGLTYHSRSVRGARAWAVTGIVLNLAMLGFFKYAGMLTLTFYRGVPGEESFGHLLLMIPLPIGISFFTFQGMSLVIDALRARDTAELREGFNGSPMRHLLHTGFFVCFFPQLVAGPIVKAHEFMPQIMPKRFADIDWNRCFSLLVMGYFLKMVVADNLKDHTFWIQAPYFHARGSIDLIVMLLGFSMQILADFWGYSLIAMGVAGLFGYLLPKNFDHPYIARSFSEFWQRWHISLSTWLREYLYYPLGGNRKGRARTYANLFMVMLLGGLWHGAAWSYAVWGGVHGLALAAERALRGRIAIGTGVIAQALQMLIVFVVVTLAWLLFQLTNFSDAVAYVQCIGTNWDRGYDVSLIYYITFFSSPVVLLHVRYLLLRSHWWQQQSQPGGRPFGPMLAPASYGLMLWMLLINSGTPSAFIYFQF